MEIVAIAGTSDRTTRLGFGCSGIVGGSSRRQSLYLLETALDAGVRHFDCAPMYGFGTAEEVLGEFLARHPGQITVTSKFGLAPEGRFSWNRIQRGITRLLPAAKLPGNATSAASTPGQPTLNKLPFTREHAALSLERSLRRLRVDRLEIFLLHEASAQDVRDPRLLEFLLEQVQRNRIGTFGIGSAPDALPALLNQKSEYCGVVQSEWSAFEPPLESSEHFRITHRGLQCGWQNVHQMLLQSTETLRAWSQFAEVDLADKTMWPKLLLRASMTVNTETIVLFSTSSPERIPANVSAANDLALTSSSLRLHQLLQSVSPHKHRTGVMAGSLHMSLATGSEPITRQDVSSNG